MVACLIICLVFFVFFFFSFCLFFFFFFLFFFFFFSSRRRHTRSLRDWSSDVCSSDLGACHDPRDCVSVPRVKPLAQAAPRFAPLRCLSSPLRQMRHRHTHGKRPERLDQHRMLRVEEIGRASCRERG